MSDSTNLPIFPLNTVLFPGGLLPLRVFEPRYMDMVRECMKQSSGFGVCLIAEHSPTTGEVMRKPGDAAWPEAVGCLAEITGWDMETLGMLHLSVRGAQRFRILDQRIEPQGLIRADVEWIEDDPYAELDVQNSACAQLLARIIAEREQDAAGVPFAQPYALGDASWVSNRLSELLPISNRARQKLMELTDGRARLGIIDAYLRQRHVF